MPAVTPKKQENPLINIAVNVLVPVMVLSLCSKDPALQAQLGKEPKAWHFGPVIALALALALPLGYGIWYFIRERKWNFFSGIGLVSVLLTGGLTLYLWNQDGSVKENAGLLFGLKEGSIPLMLGIMTLLSVRSATPMLSVFLYNDSIFDIPRIESRVAENNRGPAYRGLLQRATFLFAASFFISSLLNVGLALWFFSGFDHRAADALENYNGIVAKLTGWGFLVVGLPILVFIFFTLRYVVNGLRGITGLAEEDLMMPR